MRDRDGSFADRLRLVVAVAIVGLPALALTRSIIYGERSSSSISVLVAYLAYVFLVAFLTCWLAGSLYRLHGVTSYQLGVREMGLITILFALPLSFAKLFLVLSRNENSPPEEVARGSEVGLSLVLFMLIPFIFYLVAGIFKALDKNDS